jgi:hypothetical protein
MFDIRGTVLAKIKIGCDSSECELQAGIQAKYSADLNASWGWFDFSTNIARGETGETMLPSIKF